MTLIASFLFTAYLLTLLAVTLTVTRVADRVTDVWRDELAMHMRIETDRRRFEAEDSAARVQAVERMVGGLVPYLVGWVQPPPPPGEWSAPDAPTEPDPPTGKN